MFLTLKEDYYFTIDILVKFITNFDRLESKKLITGLSLDFKNNILQLTFILS